MIAPEILFGLGLLFTGLGNLFLVMMVRDLRVEVAGLIKVAAAPEDNLAPSEVYAPLHEFEELQKLVYSQNHIIRALHDEIEELQKKGGGKSNTTNVRPRSHARTRNVQKR